MDATNHVSGHVGVGQSPGPTRVCRHEPEIELAKSRSHWNVAFRKLTPPGQRLSGSLHTRVPWVSGSVGSQALGMPALARLSGSPALAGQVAVRPFERHADHNRSSEPVTFPSEWQDPRAGCAFTRRLAIQPIPRRAGGWTNQRNSAKTEVGHNVHGKHVCPSPGQCFLLSCFRHLTLFDFRRCMLRKTGQNLVIESVTGDLNGVARFQFHRWG